jgi:hypothetical protein
MYRAQTSGKTLAKLIQDDAAAVRSGASSLAKAQVEAFQRAVKEEGFRSNVSTLKDIAAKARRSAPSGEGAAAMTAAITHHCNLPIALTHEQQGFAQNLARQHIIVIQLVLPRTGIPSVANKHLFSSYLQPERHIFIIITKLTQ